MADPTFFNNKRMKKLSDLVKPRKEVKASKQANTKKQSKVILLDLLVRANKNYNGTANFFEKGGVPVKHEGYVSLRDLQNLQREQPDTFRELENFLYPEKAQVANAESSFDWQNMVGGILAGAGAAFTSMSDTTKSMNKMEYDLEMARLDADKEAAKKSVTDQSWVKYVLIGAGVLVVLVVIAVLLKRH